MEIYNLGDTIAGQESPKAYTLEAPSPAESALAYNDQLEAKLYDLAGIPDVMRGKVDGTQRSGEALAALALPSLALITEYRSPFRTNMRLAWLAFMSMSFEARLNKIGLDDFGHKMDMEFAPILPRDVAQINDTIAIQRSAGTMSVPRALKLSPDVTNPDEELQLIEEEQEAKQAFQQAQAELQARARQNQTSSAKPPPARGKSSSSRSSSDAK
jgi:hypothetical protein